MEKIKIFIRKIFILIFGSYRIIRLKEKDKILIIIKKEKNNDEYISMEQAMKESEAMSRISDTLKNFFKPNECLVILTQGDNTVESITVFKDEKNIIN